MLAHFKDLIDEAKAWAAERRHSNMAVGPYLRDAGVPRNYKTLPDFDRWFWLGEVFDAIKADASGKLGRADHQALERYIGEVIDRPAKELYPDLSRPDPSPLRRVHNPPAKAQQVVATLSRSVVDSVVVDEPAAAARFFRELIGERAEEYFAAAFLNVRNRIISFYELTSGEVAGVSVHPGGIFRAALLAGAAGIITCHNHPSDVPVPSAEYRAVWSRLHRVGELIGIPTVDHMVITASGRYTSLREIMGDDP